MAQEGVIVQITYLILKYKNIVTLICISIVIFLLSLGTEKCRFL